MRRRAVSTALGSCSRGSQESTQGHVQVDSFISPEPLPLSPVLLNPTPLLFLSCSQGVLMAQRDGNDQAQQWLQEQKMKLVAQKKAERQAELLAFREGAAQVGARPRPAPFTRDCAPCPPTPTHPHPPVHPPTHPHILPPGSSSSLHLALPPQLLCHFLPPPPPASLVQAPAVAKATNDPMEAKRAELRSKLANKVRGGLPQVGKVWAGGLNELSWVGSPFSL